MRGKGYVRTLALVGVLAMAAAACGGGKEKGKPTNSGGPTNKGGSVTIAAEQWPQCINVLTECASSSWTFWVTTEQVAPRAMEINLQGQYVASPVLAETPSLDNGGLKVNSDGTMVVTFKISPDATWSDGKPITSSDIAFTENAIQNTKGSYYKSGAGYDLITDVDTTDPKTAVLTYKQVFADWYDDFGGGLGSIIEASAFPKEDVQGATTWSGGKSPAPADLSKEMNGEIPFSGGPWILKSWSKNKEVLVPNKNYFIKDRIPLLDQVIFVPRLEQSTEINSVLSGDVDAAWPQPSNVSIVQQVAQNSAIKTSSAAGLGAFWEALWLNENPTAPDGGPPNLFADNKVREAFFYAVDREEVINGLIKLNQPDATVLQCGMFAYPGTPYCGKTFFDQFTYDPQKSISILESDGWDCSKVPASPCTKGGKPLVVLYRSVAGNARRETTQDLLKEKIKATGFDFKISNAEATDLFVNKLPKADFNVADYATGGTLDPSVTGSLSCAGVPTKANQYGGNNLDHFCDKSLDTLLAESDKQIDQSKRLEQMYKIYQAEVDNHIMLPLYVLPNLLVWNSTVIGGPVTDYVPSPYTAMFNMYDWFKV